MTIKNALEELDNLRAVRAKILEEGVQKCQNFNGVEDLMLVHSSQKEKGHVYEKFIAEFRQIYIPVEDLDKKKAEVQNLIT